VKIRTCNRCGEPAVYSAFEFKITEDTMFDKKWNSLDGPYVQLNDFCLCNKCMKEFVNFVKDGGNSGQKGYAR
jgi:hypothetical protein